MFYGNGQGCQVSKLLQIFNHESETRILNGVLRKSNAALNESHSISDLYNTHIPWSNQKKPNELVKTEEGQ